MPFDQCGGHSGSPQLEFKKHTLYALHVLPSLSSITKAYVYEQEVKNCMVTHLLKQLA